ncbi:hypothetical protein [Parafrankia sp. FMc2]|uniref:hypothetical protein n=1 Tax=Parafrankia sp. FMc2 TaxID=3233196 RepID=UPI0034D5A502
MRDSGWSPRLVGGRGRVALALVSVLAFSSGLAACSDNRPPKPTCRAGYVADWDDDDNEWECERRRSGSDSSSRTRRH